MIAIQNARLFNETQEALEQQTATAEVLQVVSNSMADSQPVLDKVLDSCARLFRSYLQSVNLLGDDGAIHLAAVKWNEVDDDPAYRSAIKSMNDINRKVYPIKLSPRALAALQQVRGVLSWADVLDGPDVPPVVRGTAVAAGLSYAQMMAPLISGDRHIGNITVIRKVHDAFSDKEQALLKSFTDGAVVAIQNARLFNETKEALEQQKASAEVLQVISGSMADAQPVFDKIAQSCRHLFDGHYVGLFALGDDGLLHMKSTVGYSATGHSAGAALGASTGACAPWTICRAASRCTAARRSTTLDHEGIPGLPGRDSGGRPRTVRSLETACAPARWRRCSGDGAVAGHPSSVTRRMVRRGASATSKSSCCAFLPTRPRSRSRMPG